MSVRWTNLSQRPRTATYDIPRETRSRTAKRAQIEPTGSPGTAFPFSQKMTILPLLPIFAIEIIATGLVHQCVKQVLQRVVSIYYNVYRIRNLPPRRAAVRPQGHARYRASAPTVAVRQECVLTHTLSCIRLAVALAIPDTRRACAANSIRRRLLSAALRCHPASKTGSDQHKPAVHWAVAGGEHGA